MHGLIPRNSTVSPDGRQVAYAWFNKDLLYELRVTAVDRVEAHVLFHNSEVPYLQPTAWSPDGKYILALFTRKDRTNQIVLVSTADGSTRLLKTLDWRFPLKMSFSPDGHFIVYDAPSPESSSQHDIYVLAAEGNQETVLVEHPANDIVLGWAPLGDSILFSSDRTGVNDAWTVRCVNGKPHGLPELVKKDIGRVEPIGFALNGSYYYGIQTGMRDVHIAKLDPATGRILLPPKRATDRLVGDSTWPEWSPEGQHLAYLSNQPVRQVPFSRMISIRSLTSGQEQVLAPDFQYFNRLRWCPDGSSLLTTGTDKKGRQGIYRINVQTGESAAIVQSQPDSYVGKPLWSLDGRAIFYKAIDFAGKNSRLV